MLMDSKPEAGGGGSGELRLGTTGPGEGGGSPARGWGVPQECFGTGPGISDQLTIPDRRMRRGCVKNRSQAPPWEVLTQQVGTKDQEWHFNKSTRSFRRDSPWITLGIKPCSDPSLARPVMETSRGPEWPSGLSPGTQVRRAEGRARSKPRGDKLASRSHCRNQVLRILNEPL